MIARFDNRRSGLSAIVGLFILLIVGCATLTKPKSQTPLERAGASSPGVSTPSDKSPRDARNAPMETRAYDITDLLVDVPDFDPPSLLPGAASRRATTQTVPRETTAGDRARTERTTPGERPGSRARSAAAIEQLVRESVEPESWKSGRTIERLRDGEMLVIRQTPDVHRQLEKLLNQLREARGLQILIDTKFVTLDRWAMQRAGIPADRGAGATATRPTPRFLDEKAVAALLHSAESSEHVRVVTSPRMMLFNGQRAYVLVATELAYVSGYARASTDRNRYEPTIDVASTGLLDDVQATVSPDRRSVTLTLRPEMTRLDRMVDVPWEGSPANKPPLMMQRPVVSTRTLQTTLSVPDNQTVVLGGFAETGPLPGTATAKAVPAGQPATNPSSIVDQLTAPTIPDSEMFMLVRPTIIVPNRK
jgi:hypothetical protein